MKKGRFKEFLIESQNLPPADFIKRAEALSNISMREKGLTFLIIFYGGVLAATITIIFLQGFHLWGFDLPIQFLQWLGGATIGEVAGLVALVCIQLFKR